MSVLVVGMSHRSAPVALLERLSMDDTVQTETTTALVSQPSLSEAMIISTCNRLEVYAVTNSFHSGVEDVLSVLADKSGVEEGELRSYLYVRYADAAAEHMMTVASGLDSMVVGEQQIIGQVRSSYQDATVRGTVGPGLHSLAQSALYTGKRVHTETEIDDAGASMVTLALEEAMKIMGVEDFTGKTALVLGAGAMASLAATHLGKRGINNLIIANRTRSRAERLAEHSREAGVPAEVVDFNSRAGALARVDIAVSATASDEFTITAEDISGPVMLADLSLPRDIEDAVTERDGVHLVNIEYLHQRMRESDDKDSRSRAAAEAIVAEEVSNFSSRQRVREVGPAVAQLRKAASEVTDGELARLRARVPDLSEEDFDQVSRTVRRVVDKILHTPTVKIKELAATSDTVSVETAIEELFGLGRSSVAIDAQRLPKLSEITE
ncbi:glutamyl-tRNA reductase [Corynebacterium sanguinis]|uniref:glutamyl-tRNA reductase n=1 Tax=Corynebacterium TaxID=1716 RepID=UPI0010AA8783|nr:MULTISPECIES: glutamyl-tRNA reductase [Corynebacterium]MCT1463318.1 glutamyl-tRNA reductase [Corynebacterium sanguinis]MCT1498474.1 glutamyl-tRNA reductase [Corynebacterium sanguinis]MCT1555060.1 glutamyl-tRNA reductase [Corynebacterium sanguinis]MCT1613932.1 glutamyl-tRNA reductase [Corynebacterium sanguinis]MCT1663576.1 glutamyl-tRNA reductase [Corynebacterium sanguinis]